MRDSVDDKTHLHVSSPCQWAHSLVGSAFRILHFLLPLVLFPLARNPLAVIVIDPSQFMPHDIRIILQHRRFPLKHHQSLLPPVVACAQVHARPIASRGAERHRTCVYREVER